VIEPLDGRIAPLEREPRQAARDDQRVVLLETIPGVGDLLGPTPASEIGDVARFATARKPIGYAGLAPRVHQSGERSHTGALSKPGSRTLRWAAVEAAHAARRPTNPWHELNSDIAKRTGKNPAKSALAPKILIARWHIPGRQQPSKPARPQTSGTTEISASSRCLLAARRPRTELRSRASSHQQSAHQAPKEK
jgi:transposase